MLVLIVISFLLTVNPLICYADYFDVILERAEANMVNPDILEINITVHRYQRTKRALTTYFTILKDLPADSMIHLTIFSLSNNEYKRTPAQIKRNVCSAFSAEFGWIKQGIEKTDHVFPKKCPVLKGDYHIINFAPDSSAFPFTAIFPWTNVKLQLTVYAGRDKMVDLEIYMKLDHDANLKRTR